jgi:predicted O-linked N-acetylglucosamine transferase (SPINDLY family)
VHAKPDFLLARDVLSGLYLKSGDLQKSIAESRLALKQDPDDRTAVYHLIEALRKSGNTSELPALVARMHKIVEAEAKNQAEVYRFRLVETEHAGASPPS